MPSPNEDAQIAAAAATAASRLARGLNVREARAALEGSPHYGWMTPAEIDTAMEIARANERVRSAAQASARTATQSVSSRIADISRTEKLALWIVIDQTTTHRRGNQRVQTVTQVSAWVNVLAGQSVSSAIEAAINSMQSRVRRRSERYPSSSTFAAHVDIAGEVDAIRAAEIGGRTGAVNTPLEP